jgi:hypothetical protein
MKNNKGRMIKALLFAAALLCLFIPSQFLAAEGIEPLPHAFYGSLMTTSGTAAPAGMVVTAKINGVLCSNSLTTTTAGQYGGPGGDPKLIVKGDFAEGTPIDFFVNNTQATPSDSSLAVFHSGEVTILGLTFTYSSGGGGGVIGSPTPTSMPVTIVLNGQTVTFEVDSNGKVLSEVTVVSPGGRESIIIPAGTVLQMPDGSVPSSISMNYQANPPTAPSGYNIIGQVLDMQPSGVTFTPPITIQIDYDPNNLNGADEEQLTVAYFDITTQTWINIPSTVDTGTNTVTALISHFTDYAVLGNEVTQITTPTGTTAAIPEASPTGTVPTGGAAEIETTPAVSPTTTSVPEPEPESRWPLIVGIIAAVLILGGVVTFVVTRRRRKT